MHFFSKEKQASTTHFSPFGSKDSGLVSVSGRAGLGSQVRGQAPPDCSQMLFPVTIDLNFALLWGPWGDRAPGGEGHLCCSKAAALVSLGPRFHPEPSPRGAPMGGGGVGLGWTFRVIPNCKSCRLCLRSRKHSGSASEAGNSPDGFLKSRDICPESQQRLFLAQNQPGATRFPGQAGFCKV